MVPMYISTKPFESSPASATAPHTRSFNSAAAFSEGERDDARSVGRPQTANRRCGEPAPGSCLTCTSDDLEVTSAVVDGRLLSRCEPHHSTPRTKRRLRVPLVGLFLRHFGFKVDRSLFLFFEDGHKRWLKRLIVSVAFHSKARMPSVLAFVASAWAMAKSIRSSRAWRSA